MNPTRIYLKDYQTPAFEIKNVRLFFNIEADYVLVTNQMQIKKLRSAPLELNGVDIEMISININDKEVNSSQYKLLQDRLILNPSDEEFNLEILTKIKPQLNTSLEGLYKSGNILCTQCEAEGFRKITYFLDRPDVMSSFTVTIEADQKLYPLLLSNGDRIDSQVLANGRHQVTWHDPHKKPCYLFALVAGDLGVIEDKYTTSSGRQVQLEIFASHGHQDRCYHAMHSLKKAMQWDEERFGREYDLNHYMIVAIDDFNAGAMENKGLNIFNSRLVLANPEIATDDDYNSIESVVAHEYFHNWTGNRVTLRDWFQLSLKEGLTVFRDQEFSADVSDRGLQRIADVDSLRERQFPEDAGSNAHAVRPESCLAVDNFFTPTIYEKGAELIRMMQILTGRQGFRKGMDNYFEKFDGKAVTTEDFANAISEPNSLDLTQFKLWYKQPGTPRIAVHEKFDSTLAEYHLTLTQDLASGTSTSTAEPKLPLHIPILFGLLSSEGEELQLHDQNITFNTDKEAVLHLKQKKQTFTFKNIQLKPIPSLFREFSAPVILNWEAPMSELLILIQKDRDNFNRRETAQRVFVDVFKNRIQKQKAVPPEFLSALREILRDKKMDLGFKAKMITLPSDMTIAQNLPQFDAAAVRNARLAIQENIAGFCEPELSELYTHLHQDPYLVTMTTVSYGARDLKNRALSYLQRLKQNLYSQWIEDQYFLAKNMTDRMHALCLLTDSNHPARDKALQHFADKYQTDNLVMNKWFMVQALSTQETAFAQVKRLMNHPQFHIGNPNNVYSLLKTFANNIVVFHDRQFQCYGSFFEIIRKIDAKNPQVSARLCGTFNLYEKLPTENKKELTHLIVETLASPDLSKNTRELLQSLPLDRGL